MRTERITVGSVVVVVVVRVHEICGMRPFYFSFGYFSLAWPSRVNPSGQRIVSSPPQKETKRPVLIRDDFLNIRSLLHRPRRPSPIIILYLPVTRCTLPPRSKRGQLHLLFLQRSFVTRTGAPTTIVITINDNNVIILHGPKRVKRSWRLRHAHPSDASLESYNGILIVFFISAAFLFFESEEQIIFQQPTGYSCGWFL